MSSGLFSPCSSGERVGEGRGSQGIFLNIFKIFDFFKSPNRGNSKPSKTPAMRTYQQAVKIIMGQFHWIFAFRTYHRSLSVCKTCIKLSGDEWNQEVACFVEIPIISQAFRSENYQSFRKMQLHFYKYTAFHEYTILITYLNHGW